MKSGPFQGWCTLSIADALFIARTLAAFVISAAVLATQTNAINGATANLETTTTGEKLNIADALPTEQELTGLTDDRSN